MVLIHRDSAAAFMNALERKVFVLTKPFSDDRPNAVSNYMYVGSVLDGDLAVDEFKHVLTGEIVVVPFA